MSTDQRIDIKRIIAAAEFVSVRLVEVAAKTRISGVDEAEEALLSVGHRSLLKSPAGGDRIFCVLATIDARVTRSDPAEEPLLTIQATFELLYRLPEGVEGTSEELQAFAETNALFNAWPFFREIIHATMARMNLPPIALPLFRLTPRPREEAPTPEGVESKAR